MKTKEIIDWERLANNLIDHYINVTSIRETIRLLKTYLTTEQLIELKFDEDYIENAMIGEDLDD